ncbi:hypothetical protein Tco_0623864 [Tanacetum coccineum]|uniref:Uncharacterized protein n=1 Tax=Tanacetum coccineum TaxID=301880 RepID=A0ABQ4WCF8_9ASTR
MVAYLQKPEGNETFHQIVDFLNSSHIQYALIENPKKYVSLIQQFWGTATARTTDYGEVKITASIDGQVKTITEASLRRHLKLEDSDGITSLPNTEIFEQLSLMGPKTTAAIATAIICLATNRTFNFSKMIFDAMDGLLVNISANWYSVMKCQYSSTLYHFQPVLCETDTEFGGAWYGSAVRGCMDCYVTGESAITRPAFPLSFDIQLLTLSHRTVSTRSDFASIRLRHDRHPEKKLLCSSQTLSDTRVPM